MRIFTKKREISWDYFDGKLMPSSAFLPYTDKNDSMLKENKCRISVLFTKSWKKLREKKLQKLNNNKWSADSRNYRANQPRTGSNNSIHRFITRKSIQKILLQNLVLFMNMVRLRRNFYFFFNDMKFCKMIKNRLFFVIFLLFFSKFGKITAKYCNFSRKKNTGNFARSFSRMVSFAFFPLQT